MKKTTVLNDFQDCLKRAISKRSHLSQLEFLCFWDMARNFELKRQLEAANV